MTPTRTLNNNLIIYLRPKSRERYNFASVRNLKIGTSVICIISLNV